MADDLTQWLQQPGLGEHARVFEAANADDIRAAARQANQPADVIVEVSDLRPEMFN